MSEPYLIAHLVRGEPAFDIAEKVMIGEEEGWIIPTSGHRARPFWSTRLNKNFISDGGAGPVPEAPLSWPDHYPCNESSPVVKNGDLDLEELGLL